MADEQNVQPEVPVQSKVVVEAETLPSYDVESADIDYNKMLTQFQDRAKFIAGVKKVAIAQTYPTDWLARKQRGGVANYDLMGPGAERIKSVTPIGFSEIKMREEKWTKESGPGYTIYYEGKVYIGNPRTGPLPVLGSCSSDDDFFSMETAKLDYNPENPEHKEALESKEGNLSSDKKIIYIRRRIPSADVTREHIVKSALTNLIVNGVTRILGVRRMSEEALKEYGIDISKIPSVEYGSKRQESGKLAPANEQKREELWKWLLEMANGNEKEAKAKLKDLTVFNDYKGCDDHKRLSEKQVHFTHQTVKKLYDQHSGEDAAKAKAAQAKGGKGQDGLF